MLGIILVGMNSPAFSFQNLQICHNILSRLQLCHVLSKIKANLYLPEDEEILQRMERIISDLLSKEKSSSTRQLIQTVCICNEHEGIFFQL